VKDYIDTTKPIPPELQDVRPLWYPLGRGRTGCEKGLEILAYAFEQEWWRRREDD
jgi:hypothetical protein